MPGRQGPDQIRRAIDVISLLRSGWDGGAPQTGFLLSLDLMKAFDSVSWSYLVPILQRWGFGHSFLNIIGALYTNPEAKIKLQGYYSESFLIRKGTRQGCPLSPLIFAIVIETLAIAIRDNPDIHGVRCGLNTHKCALFADDVLLFTTSPLTSLPNICRVLGDFGNISGLKVNYTKSLALNINLPASMVTQLKDNFQFQWTEKELPYLGINLTDSVDRLYAANFPPMFRKLGNDLTRWDHLGLSWLGTVNSVKMTLLPRILYLFRSLPILIPRDQLRRFQSKIIRFVWGTKGHRVAKKTLFKTRVQGGIGLPNLVWCHQAAQLSQLSVIYFKIAHPDWVHMERQAIPQYTLDFLLWCPSKARPAIMAPTLSNSLALWDSLKQNPLLISHWHLLSHIFRNPLFPPGMDIRAFQWWLDKGLYRIGHFVSAVGPLTYTHCSSRLDMPRMERFHQISHFLHSLGSSTPTPLTVTAYEMWCGQAMEQRGGITVIYRSLATAESKSSYMGEWEKDLGQSWSLGEWHKASASASKGFMNTTLIEANLKVLMRWYLVPLRIAKIYLNASPLCFRNCGHWVNATHLVGLPQDQRTLE